MKISKILKIIGLIAIIIISGMIYILFGPPDDMQRTFGQNQRNTYETWYYYSINRNFTFYDENGFGEFKLTTPYYRAVGW